MSKEPMKTEAQFLREFWTRNGLPSCILDLKKAADQVSEQWQKEVDMRHEITEEELTAYIKNKQALVKEREDFANKASQGLIMGM